MTYLDRYHSVWTPVSEALPDPAKKVLMSTYLMAPKNKTKKINLPYVNNRDNRITINTNMKDYIIAYVKLMKDVYISNRDIEVDYRC